MTYEISRRNFFKFAAFGIGGATLAAASLTGCAQGGKSGAKDDKTVSVACSPTPHAEILNGVVAGVLAKQGYKLVVREFNDYVQPNIVTEEGEVDANYYQHVPYLDDFNEKKGTHLIPLAAVHFEPFGFYPGTKKSFSEIAKGDKISIPSDATNEGRALLLLQEAGLIKIDPKAGVKATKNDVIENPHNIQLVELEAAQTSRSIKDVAFAGINANFAIDAGLKVGKDSIALEDAKGKAAQTYANILVVKKGNETLDKIKALNAALTSDETRKFITEHFKGGVLPVF